jgi:hypothetical protein
LSNAGEQVLWASGGLVVSRFAVDEAEEFDLVDDFNMLALGCQRHRPFELAAQSEAVKRSREAHGDPIGPVRKAFSTSPEVSSTPTASETEPQHEDPRKDCKCDRNRQDEEDEREGTGTKTSVSDGTKRHAWDTPTVSQRGRDEPTAMNGTDDFTIGKVGKADTYCRSSALPSVSTIPA